MNLLSVIKLAFISIGRNKMRSFLTALGIIIGVASVITMVGLGQGAYYSVQEQISKMGTNLIMVMPGSSSHRGAMGGMGSMINLMQDDAQAVLEECPSISMIAPTVRTSGQAVYGGRNWSTSIHGTTESFVHIRSWEIAEGRFFTDREALSGVKICVLGQTVAENLFGTLNPIGKIIRMKKIPLEVVGVLASKGQAGMGMDQDDLILAPLTTVQRRMMGITHINMIYASAMTEDLVESAQTEMTKTLRKRHKLGEKDEDDFRIQTQADIAETAGSTLAIIALLLGSIASVSLVVGGIGIMNIMLVSVTERTREIGIRMAIGARSRDILTQFIIEAITLSCVGGLIGMLFAIGVVHLISQFSEWPAVISFAAIIGSFLFSAMVGIFFGIYPAWKASQLNPIEALRFE